MGSNGTKLGIVATGTLGTYVSRVSTAMRVSICMLPLRFRQSLGLFLLSFQLLLQHLNQLRCLRHSVILILRSNPADYATLHCAKNRIYAIVYFAYISSIRMNICVRIREVSHWYILRIELISHCVYFEYPQMYHVRLWRIL